MATNTTVTVSDSYTQLNSGAASGNVSVFAIDNPVWLNVSASASAPADDSGAILLGVSSSGAGIIGQTLAQLWPGFSSPAYLFARTAGGPGIGGRVAVSCA